MPPGINHSVFTPDACLCVGRHFLHYQFLQETYKTAVSQSESDDSNEYIPAVGLYLCFMAIALEQEGFLQGLQMGQSIFFCSYCSALILPDRSRWCYRRSR